MLAAHVETGIIPADEFLPALYSRHPRPDVARRYRPVLNAFAIDPPIAGQVQDAGSDTESSGFAQWHEPA